MSSKKVISINPDFFSVASGGNKTSRTKKNKTAKLGRDISKQKKLQQISLKPNKIKKELLKKIKHYQKEKSETLTEPNKEESRDTSVKFSDAMKSLESIISAKKKEKREKKKQRTLIRTQNTNINKSTPSNVPIPHTPHPTGTKTIEPVIHSDSTLSLVGGGTAPVIVKNTSSQHNALIKPDPPYGCLKGGKKKTYRQYYKSHHNKTLRKSSVVDKNPSSLVIGDIVNKANSIIKQGENASVDVKKELEENAKIHERKKKLQEYKIKHLKKTHIQNKKYKKKYKVHTYRKTYRLGKKGGKINVLIRNNVTRKKVKHAVKEMQKTPLLEVKRYLKQRNMIKTGSSAPEYVLREMYMNSMLAGEVHNSNGDVLIHNYFSEEH